MQISSSVVVVEPIAMLLCATVRLLLSAIGCIMYINNDWYEVLKKRNC